MAEPSVNIDQIVREVLAALASSEAGPAADNGSLVGGTAGDDAGRGGRASVRDALGGPAPASGEAARVSAAEPAARESSETTDELRLTGRVVALADIKDRLDQIRRVVVPVRAVVTPAVLDELRRRGVTLVRLDHAPRKPATGLALVVRILGSRFDPAIIAAALEGEPVEIRSERRDCLVASTDELARELAEPNTAGLIVSTHPAMALRLAGRHRGLRAVWGVDSGRLERDLADIGANVLVVDPRTTSPYQIRRMLVDFCRRGPAECPELLRKALS
ncbi:MAG: hypothetical protein KJZ87_04460 [Thermoguttaceae bacterium]|nr:hypothetical protein [Thermoguttaceae bacterium]